jgi:hypothetical protein
MRTRWLTIRGLPKISLGATNSQNPRGTVAHVIDHGGWETGEKSARCQREKNKGEGAGGDGAVEMTKGEDVAFLRERLRMGLEYE